MNLWPLRDHFTPVKFIFFLLVWRLLPPFLFWLGFFLNAEVPVEFRWVEPPPPNPLMMQVACAVASLYDLSATDIDGKLVPLNFLGPAWQSQQVRLFEKVVNFSEHGKIFFVERLWNNSYLVATQIFFMFIPTWGNDPIWLIFFRWVGSTSTTN